MTSLAGGDKLRKFLRDLPVKARRASVVNVGFLEGGTYPNTSKEGGAGLSVPLIAFINEYGAPSRNQPPRPFFRRMIAKESPHWGADLGNVLKANDYDSERSLKLMGENVSAELKQSITDLVSPPLSPVTVKKKGFNKPLIDTGHMLNSVDYEVKK